MNQADNSPNHRKIGSQGEELSADFLRKHGYQIECQNYHYSNRGEIDIIARKGNILVFVEVKTAHNQNYGLPEYWVTKSKQQQIIKVAKAYLYSKKITDLDCRFDVITILNERGEITINHYPNAFTQ